MIRRQAEFDRCKTQHEILQAEARWEEEDSEILRREEEDERKKLAAPSLAQLERRLARVEKILGPGAKSLIDGIIKPVGRAIRQEREALAERIEKIEREPVLKYEGVWQDGAEYRANAAVTYRGSCWIAREPTSAKPGEDNTWTLAVKCGRDGRKVKVQDE